MSQPLILFDGVCNLCNGWVRFVIYRDPKKIFRFSPLQNASTDLTTIILKDGQRTFEKSSAVLHILRYLRFPWPLVFSLIVIPRPIRDVVYDFIAKRRYQWFGKRDACMVPTEDVKDRFLSLGGESGIRTHVTLR